MQTRVTMRRYLRGSLIVCTLSLLLSAVAVAEQRIAILDFELNDLTLTPGIAQEVERTASLKPMLEHALVELGKVESVAVDADAAAANVGFGYLFEHHQVAADVGKTLGADVIVVGRIHKPSFLFVYLMAHLVDVKSGRLIGDYIVEIKGPQKKLTQRGVNRLAKKIHKTIVENDS